MNSILLALVALLANGLGAFMAVPQAAQLVRSRRVDGVSPAWAAMSATTNAWWVAYGIGIDDWAIVPVGAISVLAYSMVALALLRYSPVSRSEILGRFALATVAIGILPLIGFILGGWTLAGIVLGTVYGVQLSPAVAAVYRSADISGVSPATWVLAWTEAFFWGIYALAHYDGGLGMLAVTGLIMSSAVLLRLFTRRLRPFGLGSVGPSPHSGQPSPMLLPHSG